MEASWALISFTLLTGLGMGVFAFVAISEWLGKAELVRLPGVIISLVALARNHPDPVYQDEQQVYLRIGTARAILRAMVAVGLAIPAPGRAEEA